MWEQPTATIRECRLKKIEYCVRSRYVNNVVTAIDELQCGCPLLHWVICCRCLRRPLNLAPVLQGGIHDGCLVGYLLCRQGDVRPPCPGQCRGGIEKLESGVPLRWWLPSSALPSRDSYGNGMAGRTPPSIVTALPSMRNCLLMPPSSSMSPAPPTPAQFLHATAAT